MAARLLRPGGRPGGDAYGNDADVAVATPAATSATAAVADNPLVVEAVSNYRGYLIGQTEELLEVTPAITVAVLGFAR